MEDLYNEVSNETGINSNTIKWSIRNAIGILTRSMTIEHLCSIFSLKFRPDAITPKFFINLIVEYFEDE